MTVAGLALGLKHLGSPIRVVGVCIGSRAADLWPAIQDHAARAGHMLGIGTRLVEGDLDLLDDPSGRGYGVLDPSLIAVMHLFARNHGMVVDPVYNAKVARALVDRVGAGQVPKAARVVFFNTGGVPATFEYAAALGRGEDAAAGQNGRSE
jgi:1-aminocyclopropane-1-carboxylate deaminase/D-cysteine desulfhydrase-like pyridoxal-dependent ACC family enzyme